MTIAHVYMVKHNAPYYLEMSGPMHKNPQQLAKCHATNVYTIKRYNSDYSSHVSGGKLSLEIWTSTRNFTPRA